MRQKKGISENALIRITFIDGQIAEGKFPNCSGLGEYFGRNPMTIQRDIDFMRNTMNAPIEYDYMRKGYYYSEKTYRMPMVFVTKEDELVLTEIRKLIAEHKDMPFYERAVELLDSIVISEYDE